MPLKPRQNRMTMLDDVRDQLHIGIVATTDARTGNISVQDMWQDIEDVVRTLAELAKGYEAEDVSDDEYLDDDRDGNEFEPGVPDALD